MKYNIGDRVKIISLEKVKSYPGSEGSHFIGGVSWINKYMDEFAGNTYEIVYRMPLVRSKVDGLQKEQLYYS